MNLGKLFDANSLFSYIQIIDTLSKTPKLIYAGNENYAWNIFKNEVMYSEYFTYPKMQFTIMKTDFMFESNNSWNPFQISNL